MKTPKEREKPVSGQRLPLNLDSFVWQGRRYRLRARASYYCEHDGHLWVYSCPAYGLETFSASREEALAQMHEEFAFLYDGLVNEADTDLTQDAIDLKVKLRAAVASVQSD